MYVIVQSRLGPFAVQVSDSDSIYVYFTLLYFGFHSLFHRMFSQKFVKFTFGMVVMKEISWSMTKTIITVYIRISMSFK